MVDFIVKNFFKLFGRIFYRYKIIDKHNIPQKGGALLLSNHVSFLDSFLFAGWTPRMVRFVLLKQIYEGKLHWLFKSVKIIPVSKGFNKKDFEQFNRRCRELIHKGDLVYLYPEGEMSRTNQILDFKKGLEFIVCNTDIKTIVVFHDNTTGSPMTYIPGTANVFRFKLSHLKRKIIVKVSEPLKHPIHSFGARQKMVELSSETFPYRIKRFKGIQWFIKKKGFHKNSLNKDLLNGFSRIPEKYHLLLAYTMLSFRQVLKQGGLENKDFIENDLFDFCYNKLIPELLNAPISLDLNYWRLENSLAIVSMNIPDLKYKDVLGKPLVQKSCNIDSTGKPIPGVAVKAVNPENLNEELRENQTGILLIKGFVIDCNPDIDRSFLLNQWYNTRQFGFVDKDGFVFLIK